MQATVAVCTYNPDEATLLRALDAIVPQLGDESLAELIVVDNNSEPALSERLHLSAYPMTLIRETTPGLTAAREAVIKEAHGDIIVFVDDDNVLGDDYIKTVLETFSADPHLGVLGGRIVPDYATEPPRWFGEFEHWLAIRRYAPELRVETTGPPYSDYFPVGAGLAVRRALALEYLDDCASSLRIEGRQGTALSSGEDIDLGFFALSRQYKLVVTGALDLTHVISAGRTRCEYLERLAVSNVKSSLELEQKWSARFGHSVLPMASTPLAELLLRTAATAVLSPWSPRYKVKRRSYTARARVRLGLAS